MICSMRHLPANAPAHAARGRIAARGSRPRRRAHPARARPRAWADRVPRRRRARPARLAPDRHAGVPAAAPHQAARRFRVRLSRRHAFALCSLARRVSRRANAGRDHPTRTREAVRSGTGRSRGNRGAAARPRSRPFQPCLRGRAEDARHRQEARDVVRRDHPQCARTDKAAVGGLPSRRHLCRCGRAIDRGRGPRGHLPRGGVEHPSMPTGSTICAATG